MNKFDIELRLHPDEKFFPTNRYYKSEAPNYPVYYKIDTYAYKGKRYHRVIYEIYYAENGAIGLNSISVRDERLGYHYKDIERIIILHDLQTEEPQFIFFSAHAQEGLWYPLRSCEFNNGRLVVYASLNSHSNHPKAGITWRALGAANDYTSSKGTHLNLIPIYDNDINYNAQNDEVINTGLKRFLLPFYQKSIPERKKQQREQEAKDNARVRF
jgi:hypothetical protein